jgi:acetyl-CoA carboxylase carboxyltransferase component
LVIRSASAMKMARVCEFSQASAIRDLALANRSGLRVGSEERSRSTVRAQVFSRRSAACRG